MNKRQRGIVVAALLAMASTLFYAPYFYTGRAGITSDAESVSGTLYQPVWGNPEVRSRLVRLHVGTKETLVFLEGTRLDTARLALWWFGLTIVAVAGVALARGPQRIHDCR